jgi:cell division protein FtsB
MAQDFEQFIKDLFGGVSKFSNDQVTRLNAKLNEIAREALHDELTKVHAEIAELRARVATLEEERVQASAEQA